MEQALHQRLSQLSATGEDPGMVRNFEVGIVRKP